MLPFASILVTSPRPFRARTGAEGCRRVIVVGNRAAMDSMDTRHVRDAELNLGKIFADKCPHWWWTAQVGALWKENALYPSIVLSVQPQSNTAYMSDGHWRTRNIPKCSPLNDIIECYQTGFSGMVIVIGNVAVNPPSASSQHILVNNRRTFVCVHDLTWYQSTGAGILPCKLY